MMNLSENGLDIQGRFHIQLKRRGNIIFDCTIKNGVTNAAKNAILDAFFNSGTVYSNWYMGMIDNTSYSAVDATDTLQTHTGWSEFTDYNITSSGNTAYRPLWGQDAASSQQITNSTGVSITFTANGTIVGYFITSQLTKGNSTGLLWSTALLDAPLAVQSGDELILTYILAA